MTDFPLADEFPHSSHDDWLALVDQTLKGANFDKRLVTRTYDGIAIEPLYSRNGDVETVVPPIAQSTAWRIAQAHADPYPTDANRAMLKDLEGGVTALVLRIADAPDAPGIQIWTVGDMERALRDVHLDAIPVYLDAGVRGVEVAALLLVHAETSGVDLAHLSGSIGIDPIGALAHTGRLSAPVSSCIATAAHVDDTGMQRLTISTQRYHAAGCSEAQELACALATGIAYLRGLESEGLSADAAARALHIVLTADADVFLTIAKLRAWRTVWSQVLAACGVDRTDVTCDAETASRMFTRRDPAVNMLRATTATFAAAIGGAQAVSVAPYTSALGLPTDFARRVARNCQVILQEESQIAQVADAARGSWYLEKLTVDLAEQSWGIFQSIEAEGGMVAALTSGQMQALIGETRNALIRDVGHRKIAITGVSEFPNLNERSEEVLTPLSGPTTETVAVASWEDVLSTARNGAAPAFALDQAETCEPLVSTRLAAGFETLRDRSDAFAAAHGSRPKIFLAKLGTAGQYTARASFAQNFFEAGGIEAVGEPCAPDALAAAFADSGAEIACLCSSDDVYGEAAEAATKALRGAGATRLFLAGRPQADSAGIDEFVYAGCPVLDTLEGVHRHIGLGQQA